MKLNISVNGEAPEILNIANLVILNGHYALLLPGNMYYSLGPAT